jgi:hypothetical protein
MAYTLLRVEPAGAVLLDYHLRRVGPGAARQLEAFVAGAASGVWALRASAGGLRAEARPGSRLVEGMPTRAVPSPALGRGGRFAKPEPDGLYAPVRQAGVATLLTSADGAEILEACSAAVVGWSGGLVVAPADRPRVWSTAEEAIREHLSPRAAPLRAAMPLLLVNAVKGTCAVQGSAFPEAARREIEALFAALTRR